MAERRLSPADAAWLYSEWSRNNQTVSAVAWTESLVDPEQFRDVVQQRIVDTFPTFSRRLRSSRNPLYLPYWEDDPEFDLANHLEVVELDPPGDKEQLRAIVSEQRGQLLDRDRPLWKIYQFQNYQGGTAFHCRIQHSIADGWSLVRVVLSLADEDENLERPETVHKERQRKRDVLASAVAPAVEAVSSLGEKVRRIPAMIAGDDEGDTLTIDLDPSNFAEFGSDVAEQIADGWEQISNRVGKIGHTAGTAVEGAKAAWDFATPTLPGATMLHGKVSGNKMVDWNEPRPLQPIKDAGRTAGATINDVLLAALTNALRKYLVNHNDLTVADLLTSVPVSLRKPGEPLPKQLGNRFGLIPVLLPVGISDAMDQLAEVKARLDELKVSPMPVVSFGLMSVTALGTAEVERTIHKLNQMHSIGVTTNVPGPGQPIYICGSQVLGMWGMGGVSGNMNLSFGIFTLDGELNFSVHSDSGITNDPEMILRYFDESVDELLDRTGVTA